MPQFEFTSPEGKKYRVTGPDGASNEQAFGVLQQQIKAGTIQPYEAPEETGLIDDIVGGISSAPGAYYGAIKDAFDDYYDTVTAGGAHVNTFAKLFNEENQFTPEQLEERRQQRIEAGPGRNQKDALSPTGQEVLAGLPDELTASAQGAGGNLVNVISNAVDALGVEGVSPTARALKSASNTVSSWLFDKEKANEQAALDKGLDLSRLDPGEGAGAMVHGFKSAANQAPMLALGVAGKPLSALSVMGLQVAGDKDEYDRLIEHGLSPQAAFGVQALKGGIEAGTEKYSLDRLIGKWGKNWIEEVIKYAAVETTSEITAEGLNALTDKYISGIREDMTFGEFLDDTRTMLAQLPYAMGAQTAAVKTAQVPVNKLKEMADNKTIDAMLDELDGPLNQLANRQAVDALDPNMRDQGLVDPVESLQQPDQVGAPASPVTAEANREAQDQAVVEQIANIFAAEKLGGKASGAEVLDEQDAAREVERIQSEKARPGEIEAAYQQNEQDQQARREAEEREARNQKADQDIEAAALIDLVNQQNLDIPNSMADAFERAGLSGLDLSQKTADSDRRHEAKPVTDDQRTGEDRRYDAVKRKRVDQMSPEEMAHALRTSDKNELLNERAYNEDKRLKYQSFMDIDDFKAMNTRMTYEGADLAIEALGRIMKEEAGDLNIPYHLHGDEFLTQSDDETSLNEFSRRVQERSAKAVIEFTLPDGTKITETGIGISYGIGRSKEQAETRLKADKQRRQEQGIRSGVRPETGGESVSVSETTAEGNQNQQNNYTEVNTPSNYTDPRLSRTVYRDAVKHLVTNDLTTGGGVAIVPDENFVRGESDSGNAVMKRTPSLNPQWAQDLMAQENVTVKQIQAIVDKALSGKDLGVRQQRVMTALLGQIQTERTDQRNIDSVNQARREAAWLRKYGPIELYEAQYEQFGELYQESEYDPEWDAEARSFFEIANEAAEIDQLATESIITRSAREDWSVPETVKALYDEIINRKQDDRQGSTPVDTEEASGKPQERPKTEAQKTETIAPSDEGVSDSGPNEKIDDLGEKIGGARKDLSTKTGPKHKDKSESKIPAWKNRYVVVENMLNSAGGEWVIFDSRTKRPLRIGYTKAKYSSKEEAEKMLPVIAVADKHNVYGDGKDGYTIWRINSAKKRVRVVAESFETREAAMEYMAKNAEAILETKLSFGEEMLPTPEKVYRNGDKRRDGNVSGEDFMNTFGFRGVEFGKWNNQDERQEVMNHAYDALLDMAEIINVPPLALSLNGDLALAFGARGQGLSGAKAHYEPKRAVINLTKMNGAGSLAHEWFHGLDHYFARLDGKASSEKEGNDKDGKTYKIKNIKRTMATHGFLYNSKARKELREAYKNLVVTMFRKAEKYVEDTQQAEKFLGRARDELKNRLDDIRRNLAAQLDTKYYKRNNKPATDEQLARFDELSDQLIDGEMSALEMKTVEVKNSRTKYNWRQSNDILEEMSDIYKKVRGRAGFSSKGDDVFDRLRANIKFYADRIKVLNDAKSSTGKTKKVPTDFYMQAKAADQARTDEYWSSEHEMAARAFAAYVEDKLAEKDHKNDFLAYHAHGAILVPVYPEGFFRPYPEGKERVAVNKAFDELFNVIEHKETDKGVALFKRSNKSFDGLDSDSVNAVVSRIADKWKNAPDITVVQRQSDLPDAILEQTTQDDIVHGVRYKDSVYLVADNLESEKHVEETLLHESLLHYGARQTFGKKEFDSILVHLWNSNDAIRTAAAHKILELGVDKKTAVEEVLADMAGRGKVKQLKGWKKLWQFIKDWLTKNGFIHLSSDEVVDYVLRASAESVIRGGKSVDQDGEIEFSKSGIRFSRNTSGSSAFNVADETLKDQVARKLQDKFQRLYKTQEAIKAQVGPIDTSADAYAAEERMHGKIEYDFNKLEEDYIEPLAESLAVSGIPMQDLDMYLYAKHAPERNKQIAKKNEKFKNDGGSGMSTNEAETKVAFYEKKYGEDIKRVAQKVYDLLKHKRQILRDQDLGNDELVDVWENTYQYYVPLKGFAEDAISDEYPRIGKGLSIKGAESKKALGRESLAFSPVSQSIQDVTESIIRARKNEVGLHLLNLVEAVPNPDFWQVFTDENPDQAPAEVNGEVVQRPVAMRGNDQYFGVKRDGKQHYIKIKDARLKEAMQNLGVEKQNVIIQTLGSVNRFLSSVNTSLNPEFVVSNFSRDIQTAVYNLLAEQDLHDGKVEGEKIAAQVVKDVPRAMRSIYRELRGKAHREDSAFDQYAEDFIADGGKTGFFDMKDLEAQKRHVESLVKLHQGGVTGAAKKVFSEIGALTEHVNGAVENAVRLSSYIHARQAMEAQGISEGDARKRAASLAKNLTVNFNRRGEWSTVANSLYMFFNASVQGTAQFARTMLTMKQVDGKRRLNLAQKSAIGIYAFAYVLAHLNRALADDDDDGENLYDKIPAHVKERNMIIMDFMGDGAGRDYTKIPLPYGYNIFHVLGTVMNDTVHGSLKATDGIMDVTMALLGSFNPVGISESDNPGFGVMKTLTPTVLTPGIELYGNENFFGQPIWLDDKYNDRTPDSSLSYASTKEHYKHFAEWLNRVTGGSMYEKGKVDLSPDSLEHLVEFVTGGAGRFVDKTVNLIDQTASDVEVETYQIPFVGKVRGEPNPYSARTTYYERRSLALAKMDAFNGLRGQDREDFKESHADMIKMGRLAEKHDNQLKALRKRRDRQLMKDLDRKERKAIQDEYNSKSKAEFDEFNKKWNESIEKD